MNFFFPTTSWTHCTTSLIILPIIYSLVLYAISWTIAFTRVPKSIFVFSNSTTESASSYFLSKHQNENISYVPLNLVANYVYIANLNTRLRVGWKTLPNLNFKPKFQTHISNSNLNFKAKIFPVLLGNSGFWEIDSKGKRNEINKAMCCSLGKSMSWYRGGTEGF